MINQPRKPLKWVGSSKRDLDAMPGDVQDVFGHAIDLAIAVVKLLAGFGGGAVWCTGGAMRTIAEDGLRFDATYHPAQPVVHGADAAVFRMAKSL